MPVVLWAWRSAFSDVVGCTCPYTSGASMPIKPSIK